jgi:hypothetical protein
MARKVVSRKELRAEAEAAEEAEKAAPKKKKKKAATRKRKAKVVKEVRLKAFWGIFTQGLKRVAIYEYSQKRQAEKKATDLSAAGNKTPHFVQLVKEVIEE